MLRPRVIPCLSLIGDILVKTVRFRREAYIGDPVNTARIFNELEVDELMVLDIRATPQRRTPDLGLLAQLASECFMPLAYGGGVATVEMAKTILSLGIEKVVVNTAAHHTPALVEDLAGLFGSQAVVASVDIKRGFLGRTVHYIAGGTEKTRRDALAWAQELQRLGAGELLLTSMKRDGTWSGFDVDLLKKFSHALSIPLIAAGGAGTVAHIGAAVHEGGASAVALGSMVVYQKQGMGVLVNFPDKQALEGVLY